VTDTESGKLLELHMAEGDRYETKALYEAIVTKCRELHVSGVTVFRGLEGYGPTAEIHRARLMSKDQPIVVLIADRAEVLEKALPQLTEMMGARLTVISDIQMKRVQKALEST
jgi:hypothetical protein